MLYKGKVIPVENIEDEEVRLEYYWQKNSIRNENQKKFHSIDAKDNSKLAKFLGKILDELDEDESYTISDKEIISLLDKEYGKLTHDYYGHDSSREIIYEKVEDEDGNVYGKEILTGSLFPIGSDNSICIKKYEIEKTSDLAYGSNFVLTIRQSFSHRNYAKLDTILVDNEVASPNDIEEYETRFDYGFRHAKRKEEFLNRIIANSKTNTLAEEVEVSVIKPKKKEKKQRENQDNMTVIMESIEYLLQRLKKINPDKAKEFSEQYEKALSEEDILKNKTISLATLISLQAKLEFELLFTKGENTTITDKLEELRKEYIMHFVTDSEEKTNITLDDLDKLMELFLKTKDSYSIIEQRKILRNFASVYALEVKENESEITIERLQDSYFEDLKKSILIFIDALIENGFVKSNMMIELSNEETTEEILNLLRSLEFNKLDSSQLKLTLGKDKGITL